MSVVSGSSAGRSLRLSPTENPNEIFSCAKNGILHFISIYYYYFYLFISSPTVRRSCACVFSGAVSEVTIVSRSCMHHIRDRKCIFTFIGSNFYCCPAIKVSFYWYCFHIAAACRCCMKTPPFERVNVLCHLSYCLHLDVCTNVTLRPPPATVWAIYLYAPYRLGVVSFLALCGWVWVAVLFLILFSFFIPLFRYCYCCCCYTCRRLNGAPLETHSNRLTIIFIRITVAAAAISRWLVSFHPFDYSADIARYLYVDILCLIEFRPDLNNEKTTRWNRNGKRDKGRSSALSAAASNIFL